MQNKKVQLLVLLIFLSFVSCTPQKTQGTQTAAQEILTLTPVPYKTPTLSAKVIAPTANSSNTPDVSKLEPATYLLYIQVSDTKTKIYALKPGEKEENLLLVTDGYIDISSNGKFLAYANYANNAIVIWDVESSQVSLLPLPSAQTNCADFSISADGTMIACGGDDIYIITLEKKEWIKLTNWSNKKPEDTWDNPKFAPNGKWIAYFNLADIPFSATDGIYLTNLSCFTEISNCKESTIGPITNLVAGAPGDGSFISWSPDSQEIIFPGRSKLYTINIKTGKTDEISLDANPNEVSWSPTGDVIAFKGDEGIYLVSTSGKNKELVISDVWLSGWLTIPWKFTKGDTYKITEKGSNLNLRELPSLGGKLLTSLTEGNIITILDGPISADGYLWWNVSSQNNISGWVVDIPDWYQLIK